MNAILILSCDGRQDDGFKFCEGVENIILDLEEIEPTENYLQMIEYLDKVPKIFDSKCFTKNIVANTIYKIYEMGYMTEVKYKHVCNFYQFHARCGLILSAIPKDLYDDL